MTQNVVGGWTGFGSKIDAEAKKAFDQALEGLVGASYKPLAVATQVVAGLNYCFLCQGTLVTPGQQEFAAKVYVFKPLGGEPARVENIERVDP
ncbi:MAG: hypothetical protein AAGN66_13115 [Acidobacteriota bacterium]